MTLHLMDWLLVIAYFALTLLVGLAYSKRAGGSVADFFISGRRLPWWLAGTSMVATTFAADTPLVVTGLVAKYGIAGNWLWWNFVFSGMLTVFLYARLWRRAGVLTDVEFTELRYSGQPAAILRGFRALYLAIPINCIIMGWVTLAMTKILSITLGVEKVYAVVACLLVTLIYSTLSGLWGVVVTDFVQFIIAVAGSIILAVFSIAHLGGIGGLKASLGAQYGDGGSSSLLSFVPPVGSTWMPLSAFLVYVAVQWWAAWYPGAEPGGGGYIAQRIFSAKDEKHSVLATLWFNVAHYALRPWPWILVALGSMVAFPQLVDKEAGYVHMMVRFLPTGFAGLMLAAFAAAFMSTISTQINWGSSYLVNDFYRRFIRREATEKHYVRVSRAATVVMMILGGIIAYHLESIEHAWKFLLAFGAGTGAVYLLRWFWWRINAWSEISAMMASFVASTTLQSRLFGMNAGDPHGFAKIMLLTVGFSTVVWVIVTYLTKPEPEEVLLRFYRKTRPGGPLWKPIARKLGNPSPETGLSRDLGDWIAGCVLIYCALFGIGKLILGEAGLGAVYWLIGLGAGAVIYRDLSRRGWQVIAE